MSSDSGESHTSAQNGDAELGAGSIAPDSPIQSRDAIDADDTQENATGREEQQELESLVSGANGLTFATHRRTQEETNAEESESELSIRPAAQIPGSPDSALTPDDTPSIQVG